MSDVAFANPINMATLQNGQMAQHGTDNSLLVEFYKESVFQEAASAAAGRPVYKDFDYIHITLAGGKSEIRRPVKLVGDHMNASDPERFPRQWHAFQNQHLEARDGLPLEQCPFLPKAEVMGFKAGSIHTVEQLAGIPDSALHNFGMNARKWRDMAIAYLARANENKDISALVSELQNLKRDYELLKGQFLSVSGGAEPKLPAPEAPAPAPKKRGPKPKVKES